MKFQALVGRFHSYAFRCHRLTMPVNLGVILFVMKWILLCNNLLWSSSALCIKVIWHNFFFSIFQMKMAPILCHAMLFFIYFKTVLGKKPLVIVCCRTATVLTKRSKWNQCDALSTLQCYQWFYHKNNQFTVFFSFLFFTLFLVVCNRYAYANRKTNSWRYYIEKRKKFAKISGSTSNFNLYFPQSA